MTLSEELLWRGLVKDKTFAELIWLDKPQAFYLGADVGSADSLTVGNLAVFMLARRLLRAGWQAVLLMGGATSLIGDPGGKESERELVSREQVEQNKKAISDQVENLFIGQTFTLVDNYDWFKDVGYLDFLRDVGKHYSITELVQRDFVADRMGEHGSGISYAEFSYSLIQGYDYWHLFKEHQVVLQIGGSDQWGNMLSGVPLIRKKEGAEVHALSMPLVINKATGKKFGKSEEGAIWLDPNKTSVYQFYQFWLNADDEGVETYLKIFTELAKDHVDAVIKEFSADRTSRLAQKTLAYEVTKLVHGGDRAESVRRVTNVLFGGQQFDQLQADDYQILAAELQTVQGKVGEQLTDCLVAGGLLSSKSEARRLLEQGGLYINNHQLHDDLVISKDFDLGNSYALVRKGKNDYVLLSITRGVE